MMKKINNNKKYNKNKPLKEKPPLIKICRDKRK